MNFGLLKFVFVLLFLFSFINLNAQQTILNSTVSGKLIDSVNGRPLELATVSLFRNSGNHLSKVARTDAEGNFTFSGMENGIYVLQATFVGYMTYVKDSILISPSQYNLQLGNIKMRIGKGVLSEMVVTASKSGVQLDIDKKSFDVDESLVSQGGSLADLLSNIPSVQFDINGNISIHGSTNVNVLINGRPSALTGGGLADILQSFPASIIQKIELITNPSSRYQAEGVAGIINIVLKKNDQVGLTGSAMAAAGTHDNYNGTFNIAYKNNRVNIYTGYSGRHTEQVGYVDVDKTTVGNNSVQAQYQTTNQMLISPGQNILTGIDITLGPNSVISFSNNINYRGSDRYQDGTILINQNNNLLERIVQNNILTAPGTNLDFNIDFDKKFKKKGELFTANIQYSPDKSNSPADLNSYYYYYSRPSHFQSTQENTTIGMGHNANIQADYSLPLKNGKLDAGFRGNVSNNDNNYIAEVLNTSTGGLVYNPLLSNHFIYDQNVEAVYTDYLHTFGNFSVQGGLRLEDAFINTQLVDSIKKNNNQDYLRLYPSLFLTEKLSANQTLQLSYSRRVTRPTNRQLSPFINESNRFNYITGNPSLLPQDSHSFELSFLGNWEYVKLSSSLYYRLTNDNIQQITIPLSPKNRDTTITEFENVKNATNAGYELIANARPFKILDFLFDLNIYYKYIPGDPVLGFTTTAGYTWNFNLTANLRPLKKLRVQIRGDYQGKQAIPNGVAEAVCGANAALTYDLTKQFKAGINVTDLFNSRVSKSVLNYKNAVYQINQVTENRPSYRIVLFTATYRFGNNRF